MVHRTRVLWEALTEKLNQVDNWGVSDTMTGVDISSVQTVPKQTPRKFRLINNLLPPHGSSINDANPDNAKSLKYSNISDVVDLLL